MISLDFGSGNTCRNDWNYAKRMINALADIDRDRKCVIKWQLFKEAGKNNPLNRDIFKTAYGYAKDLGFQTTASVFDKDSLDFLLKFEIPFVKIANRRDLDWLIDWVPRGIEVIRSIGMASQHASMAPWTDIMCVSKYPAKLKDYADHYGWDLLHIYGISDHTTDWKLYREYTPARYECHFCLDDSTGLDAGPFARRPAQLKEIL